MEINKITTIIITNGIIHSIEKLCTKAVLQSEGSIKFRALEILSAHAASVAIYYTREINQKACGRLLVSADYLVKVKNSSPKSLSADYWYTVGKLSTDSIPTVNQQLTNSKPTPKKLRSVMTSLSLNPYRSIRISCGVRRVSSEKVSE